ncbi:PQQ-binding-like beta-propeller repeat protein [Streptomyces sp. SP17BM10]|uniref:outer membrane protein assembly factor BamB family protein n=1 Tax=Streptomyces sp. SP17BM10 TaxID=3002530 RepID=UPI002E7A6C80|nr:PQQ-binding-like beta-propeller repeat protein [Streptomyces sp. SP17BM10]MEE1781695.1 PQQ-binding-like beta-propeller repeat protein [Streptomyces sp. SP17BM10]
MVIFAARYRDRRWAGAVALAVTLVGPLSGCSGSTPLSADGIPPAARHLQAFDPPTSFDFGDGNGTGDALDEGVQPSTSSPTRQRPAISLKDTTAFVTTEDGMKAVDAVTRNTLWSASSTIPATKSGFGSERAAPLPARFHGADAVLAAFSRFIPGTGTGRGRNVIEVLAADSTTGRTVWSAQVDLVITPPNKEALSHDDSLLADGIRAAQVVAVDDQSVVVSDDETTYVVDAGSGQLRWTRPDFHAMQLVDGIVAGAEAPTYGERQLAGYGVSDGSPRWSAVHTESHAVASSTGPGLLAMSASDGFVIVDARTGAIRAHPGPGAYVHPWHCDFDGTSVILCNDQLFGQTHSIAALDATSMKWLWSITETPGGRLVPVVTAVWHGAVYGRTTNGNVILDARTGADRATPKLAPFLVNAYVGIEDRGHSMSLMRSTG